MHLNLLFFLWIVERTAGETPAVVGYNGILAREVLGNAVEGTGIATSTVDQKQDGARAAYFIGELCAGYAQSVAFC